MKLITTAQLRKSEAKTRLDEDTLIVCAMGTEVKLSDDEECREIDFTISSEAEDSYRDIVKADGWDLERYLKNPVVLWSHLSRELPIGSASNVRADGASLKATAKFAERDTYEFADDVFKMLKAGFLKATSVGFIPQEWSWDEQRGGYNFIKSELFEFSVVPVPANPDALMNSIAEGGEDAEFLREWCEKTLDMWRPEGHQALWVPKSKIEDIHKLVCGDVTQVSLTAPDANDEYHEFWNPIAPVDLAKEASVQSVVVKIDSEEAISEIRAAIADLKETLAGIAAAKDVVVTSTTTGNITIDLDVAKEDLETELRGLLDIIHNETAVADDDGEGIDPEVLRAAVKEAAETAIMNRTGKLPEEV